MNENLNFGDVIYIKNFKVDSLEANVLRQVLGFTARTLIDNYETFYLIKVYKIDGGIKVKVYFKDQIKEFNIMEENIFYAVGQILQKL